MNTDLLDDDMVLPNNNDEESSHEYAALKYRLAAFIIDLIILVVVLYPFKFLPTFHSNSSLYLFLGFFHALIYLYFLVQECGKHQATIGKRMVNIIITNLAFDKISLKQSFLRTTFKMSVLYFNVLQFVFMTTIFKANVSMYITDHFGETVFKMLFLIPTFLEYLFPFLIIISIIRDNQYRGWHDKIAGTVVLREIKKIEESEIN